ncbi:glycoside hydrolase family 55 protein [Afipia felis]|uniref:Poly(Beta-D-mannuronate) C5 epimerase 7 n=2 Tax=Afipia felis TaxID=1035 RepID=A0A380WBM6_AFIFE|nr:glycoside hydrolase family 55 protein [Afipia felis]EKS29266.1 hypothetical protein HMPREF9697_01794 [Afipia felis ATCC 53690]SUU77974.1 Poly(beta-D-mannuronate) C5 epimerase 7 [Afipia felis]SUU86039.1 Poly(beta-D-mannuronate) C5 epimerase 7 [Afipia felis]
MSTILSISDFVYQTGTLTIAPGDTTAVFSGTSLASSVKDGDYLFAGGSLAVIQTVTDDTHAELFTEWAGAAVTSGSYLILKASLLRYHTALIGYDSASLLAMLDGTNVWYVVEGAAPDPSIGEDGNRAIKTNVTPWKIWLKTGGVWVLQPGSPGGQGDPGADGATWIVQAAEPGTDYPANSLWIDSDSADLDVYQLGGSPLDWVDTGINLKGAQGPAGAGVPAGGSTGQVLARDSGTGTEWIDPPSGGGGIGFNVKDYGAVGDDSTDDTSSINSAISACNTAGGGFVYFPPGSYAVSSQIIMKDNVRLVGAGEGASTIRLTASYTAQAIIEGTGVDRGGVTDLAIDAGDFTSTGSVAIRFTNATDIIIERNIIKKMGQFGIVFNGVARGRIAHNTISLTTASSSQNQGILGSDSTANTSIEITRNDLINTALNFSGSKSTITHNRISNWKFGAGITIEQASTCHTLVIEANHCSGGTGTDVNGYVCGGIETWSPKTVVSANLCFSNAGAGIDMGGFANIVSENLCFDNGSVGIIARYGTSTYNASNSIFIGNRCYDQQGASGTQTYGYKEENSSLSGIMLGHNNFAGNKTGTVSLLATTTTRAASLNGSLTSNALYKASGVEGSFVQSLAFDDGTEYQIRKAGSVYSSVSDTSGTPCKFVSFASSSLGRGGLYTSTNHPFQMGVNNAQENLSLDLDKAVTVRPVAAVPAGGDTSVGLKFTSTANLGIFIGSGAPTLSAAKGSLYIRTDGSSTSTRMYVNNGGTTWVAVTTAS